MPRPTAPARRATEAMAACCGAMGGNGANGDGGHGTTAVYDEDDTLITAATSGGRGGWVFSDVGFGGNFYSLCRRRRRQGRKCRPGWRRWCGWKWRA